MNIREARDNYLLEIKHLDKRTQKDYQQKLRTFVEWAERQRPAIQLEQVSNGVFAQFLDHLRQTHSSHTPGKPISTHTLAGYHRAVRVFLNWCLDDEEYAEFVKPVTVRRLKRPRTEEFLIHPFTIDQVEALLKACRRVPDPHLQLRDRTIVMVLWKTGIRANELCTLRLMDVNLTRLEASITVMGKGKKQRRLPLEKECRELLKKYIQTYREPLVSVHISQELHAFREKKQRRPTEKERTQIERTVRDETRVFASRYRKPMTVNAVDQMIHHLGEWAEVKGVRCSPHTFRHTYARAFILDGGDIYELSKLLGHGSVKVTEEYLKSLGAWDMVTR